jgi:hypothetical protein
VEPNGRVSKINDLTLSTVTSTKLKLQNTKLNFHREYTFQTARCTAIKRDVASDKSIFAIDLEIKRKLQIAKIWQG